MEKLWKGFFLSWSQTMSQEMSIFWYFIFHGMSISSPHRTAGKETPFWDPGKSGHKNFHDFKTFDFTGQIQDDIKVVESGTTHHKTTVEFVSQIYNQANVCNRQRYSVIFVVTWPVFDSKMARSCEARVGDLCFILVFPKHKETTCTTVYGEPFHKELDGETSKRYTDKSVL